MKAMKIFQIHHQDEKNGSTEFIAQNEIENEEQMSAWTKDVTERNPLPEGKIWLICNEKSRHFIMTNIYPEPIDPPRPIGGIKEGA